MVSRDDSAGCVRILTYYEAAAAVGMVRRPPMQHLCLRKKDTHIHSTYHRICSLIMMNMVNEERMKNTMFICSSKQLVHFSILQHSTAFVSDNRTHHYTLRTTRPRSTTALTPLILVLRQDTQLHRGLLVVRNNTSIEGFTILSYYCVELEY